MTRMPRPNAGTKASPVLIIFLIFPILGLVAAAVFAVANTGPEAGPTPLPVTPPRVSLINRAAPNFELPGLDGRAYRLSNYRGRVVFLNFWATWCEPCLRELPAFQAFMAQQGADGAVILAINQGETPEQIEAFFAENAIAGLPVLLDDSLAIANAYHVDRMPTTYALDPAGVVRYMHLGEMKLDDLNSYVARLSQPAP